MTEEEFEKKQERIRKNNRTARMVSILGIIVSIAAITISIINILT